MRVPDQPLFWEVVNSMHYHPWKETAPDLAPPGFMEKKLILVVDDDEDIRFALKDALEFGGFQTALAHNGKHALQILAQIEKPDLILLDVMMPVMNGWDFLEAVKRIDAFKTIPIVLMSAFQISAQEIQERKVSLIKKPFEFDYLFNVVEKRTA